MNRINSMPLKILILDAGEAPYPLTVARSLGSIGHNVDLGFSFGSKIFAGFSKYCRKIVFYPDPTYAPEDFLTFFEKISGKYDFIIPCMEKTMLPLSKIKDYLEERGTFVPIPPYKVLSLAVNKAKVLEICNKNKILIPKTIIAYDLPDIDDIVNELGVPFIMKVSTEINIKPGPGSRYFVFRNKPSQKYFQTLFRRLQSYGPVILQEWIKGTGIGASFIFSRFHEPIAFFGHRRILERFPDGGPSVIAETYFHLGALKEGAKLLKILMWQGVAMTEFKLSSNGKLYFIELNPRFWGTLPLAIASGLDFPRLLIEYYNSSSKNIFFNFAYKKKIFVKSLTIPYLFINSIKLKNLKFAGSIIRVLPEIFKYGFPFIVEVEKFDLIPLIKKIEYSLRGYLAKKTVTRINKLLFGPAIPYEKLIKYNVKSIIDLRENHEKRESILPQNFDYFSFPIKDDSAPELFTFLSLISLIEKCLQKGGVYIHCRVGRGRAPMAVIGYLLSRGIPLDKAYLLVYDIKPYCHLNLIQKRAIYDLYKKVYSNYSYKNQNKHEDM